MSSILIISPESWDGHAVSKHHYAIALAKRGHHVIFYGRPIGTKAMIDRPASGPDRLQILHAPAVAPGLRFLPTALKRSLERRFLKSVETLAGRPVDVVWLFENSRFYNMSFAGDRLKIYHQVDLNQDFHADEAARTADFAFCTSDVIAERIAPTAAAAGTPLVKVHHGVSEAAFTPSKAEALGPGPNILYVGNLSMRYIDLDLLAGCVAAYPSATFHFVGGGGERLRDKLKANLNVVWHGKVASDRIADFTVAADVLLVVYAEEHWHNQSSPHKVMEYLASGRTIVATWTDEYRDNTHLLEMVDDPAAFVPRLGSVLKNLPHYNSAEKTAERRAFACEHTYARQLDRIAAAMGPLGQLLM